MSDLSISGFRIRANGDLASISQTAGNGVTTTVSVSANGDAELKRCKKIQGKDICLSEKDKNLDRHGVSRIAANGLGQCHAAMKSAIASAPLPTAEAAIRSCEIMYAHARSNELSALPPNAVKENRPIKLAGNNTAQLPEKPLKK